MRAHVAVATVVLGLAASGLCLARQAEPASPHKAGGSVLERLRDINLTEAQEAAIAGIRDEYEPKVDEAVAQLTAVVKEEMDQARVVLTPEQLQTLDTMLEERKALRVEGLACRIAHLRNLDLTDDELTRIAGIRKEYRAKIVKALEGLKPILTPEQAKMREDALKAGKSRKEVIASLKLTDDQKGKVETVGKEVRALVREELDKVRDVLNPEQKEKLAAMKEGKREHVRDRIAFAIANYKELNLTDEQQQKLQAIPMEYRPRVEQAGNQLRAIVREELAAIIAVLKA